MKFLGDLIRNSFPESYPSSHEAFFFKLMMRVQTSNKAFGAAAHACLCVSEVKFYFVALMWNISYVQSDIDIKIKIKIAKYGTRPNSCKGKHVVSIF